MSRYLSPGAAIALALLIGPWGTGSADAQPESNAEVATRPCIGQLSGVLYSLYCVGDPRPPGLPAAVVDCDKGPSDVLARAVAAARPGATLRLRSLRRACVGGFTIDKSLTLESADGTSKAVIAAPAGRQCVAVGGPGRPHVTFRNLQLDAAGSPAACLSVSDARASLAGSIISYDGDDSAVTVAKGGLDLDSGVVIVARTVKPAVVVDGDLSLGDARIAAAVTAVALTPGRDLRLTGGRLERLDDWTGSERTRNAFGLVLHLPTAGRLAQVSGLSVSGFNRGVYVDGGPAEVLLDGLVIRDADWGLLADGPRVSLQHGEIYATEVGVYVAKGEGDFTANHIFGVRRAGLYSEQGARVRTVDNHVYASSDGCAALEAGILDLAANNCTPWYDQVAMIDRGSQRRVSFEDLRRLGGALALNTGAR